MGFCAFSGKFQQDLKSLCVKISHSKGTSILSYGKFSRERAASCKACGNRIGTTSLKRLVCGCVGVDFRSNLKGSEPD